MNVLLAKYRRQILFRLFRSVNHFQIRFKGKKNLRIKYVKECKFRSNILILRKYKWISVIPGDMIISSLLFENVSITAPHTHTGTKTPPPTLLWSGAAGSHSNCGGWEPSFDVKQQIIFKTSLLFILFAEGFENWLFTKNTLNVKKPAHDNRKERVVYFFYLQTYDVSIAAQYFLHNGFFSVFPVQGPGWTIAIQLPGGIFVTEDVVTHDRKQGCRTIILLTHW